MSKNEKSPTFEELLERRKQLIQKAADGKNLSGDEIHFLDLLDIWLAKHRDEQARNRERPIVEQLKKRNPFVQDVFRSTEYFNFTLWCIEIPFPVGHCKDCSSTDTCGCWITANNNTTYEEMCRRLENVKTEADILALSTTPNPVQTISAAILRWKGEAEELCDGEHQ